MKDLGKNEVTYVLIEIAPDDLEIVGVGIELGRKAGKSFYPYAIMSLALDRSEYSSTYQTLKYAIEEALKYVPESDKMVVFKSTSDYFTHSVRKFKRQYAEQANGKELLFYKYNHTSLITKTLAQDALKPNRRDSIIEIFKGGKSI